MYLIGSAWNRCFSRVWNSIKHYLWTGFVKTQKLNVNMNCSEHFFLKFLCVCATSFHCHFWCFLSAFSESTDHTGQQFSTWLHIRLCGNFLTKSILKKSKSLISHVDPKMMEKDSPIFTGRNKNKNHRTSVKYYLTIYIKTLLTQRSHWLEFTWREPLVLEKRNYKEKTIHCGDICHSKNWKLPISVSGELTEQIMLFP